MAGSPNLPALQQGRQQQQPPPPQSQPGDDALLSALLSRGKKPRRSIVLSDSEVQTLVERVVRDFNDGAAASGQWYKNHVELIKNWEGIVDQKTFPYEDAANIRVPFTSSQAMQWIARTVKAVLGGDQVTHIERLDESVDPTELEETNQWFQWELEEVVKLEQAVTRIFSQAVLGGICLPIPRWCKERRSLCRYQEFDFDPSRSLPDQLQAALSLLFDDKDYQITSTNGRGIFRLQVKDPDEPTPDPAKVTFCIRNNRLCADSELTETTFNGVKIDIPNKEDLVLINTHPDIEKLPFNGVRMWLSVPDYREGLENGEWDDLGEDLNNRILATATSKVPEIVPMDYTALQDEEEGTTSTDPAGVIYERRFIEVYRWEGKIHRERDIDDSLEEFENVLTPTVNICTWCVPRARVCIRTERLEALNKDGERSMVKFGFIERDNRLFDIGLVEWLRHVQAELDGIHNLRLDSATLTVMPFGFYKPLAGLQKDIFRIKPGHVFPTADPSSVNFPRTNANPQWSYQDEGLIKKYGSEQSGLSETANAGFVSKRQSASEYLGSQNSVDLRTELVVNGFLRSLRKLLYRVLGLYQQFAPPTRIFQVAGQEGVKLVKRFQTDRLHGKVLLRLTGNLDQINPQLQRDVATNMLSLLLNQILIQLGIVKPNTIYAAVKAVAKAMHYGDVPIHKPDIPEESPYPDIENRMMYAGQAVEPHLDEPFDMHIKSHTAYLIDRSLPHTQKADQLVTEHLQKTQQMMKIAFALRQMEGAQAVQAQKQMETMGIRPGQSGGQQPGDNTGAGTQEEGVQGQTSEAA